MLGSKLVIHKCFSWQQMNSLPEFLVYAALFHSWNEYRYFPFWYIQNTYKLILGPGILCSMSVIMLISFFHSLFSSLISVTCVVIIVRNVHLDFNFLHKASQGIVYMFKRPVLLPSLLSVSLACSLLNNMIHATLCHREKTRTAQHITS